MESGRCRRVRGRGWPGLISAGGVGPMGGCRQHCDAVVGGLGVHSDGGRAGIGDDGHGGRTFLAHRI